MHKSRQTANSIQSAASAFQAKVCSGAMTDPDQKTDDAFVLGINLSLAVPPRRDNGVIADAAAICCYLICKCCEKACTGVEFTTVPEAPCAPVRRGLLF
jgi:hypothetical protein